MGNRAEMKQKVARTVKWSAIDKVAGVALNIATGIALANILPREDFGLVAAVLVFQAFAAIFVEGGFATALIQKKRISRKEYSSVMWFNLAVAAGVYLIMYLCAPLIAKVFDNDQRLIPLGRVMFLTFVINASAMVQTSRLYKLMQVKMIAASNAIATIVSSAVALVLAIGGFGAWALVWQAITLAAVKSGVLWIATGWRPRRYFSIADIRRFFKVGSGMLGATFLNVLFAKIYGLIVGNRAGILPLSYYGQADKWSTMGVSTLLSTMTSSFLPALSAYQDNKVEFAAATAKMNRFASYIMFPCLGLAVVVATPLFHVCFGTKWDAAIILFQLLMLRGVFTSLSAMYNNYIIARGHTRLIITTEIVRDVAAAIAICVTLPFIGLSTAAEPTKGIAILLWGQIAASALTWLVTMVYAARLSWRRWWEYVTDSAPYAASCIIALLPCGVLARLLDSNIWLLAAECITTAGIYLGVNALLGSKIQKEVISWLLRRS
jgi:O-antigen/teichoic acid export membrane protein